ncbi:hypothetical protein NS303_08570 [Pantoea ananatis]|nr:hypothetical protein NS303_08570 [Pantoea ananatis]KTR56115.1 hypothetical protein NS311_08480 [Pantoea ananatis]KTR65001.1 hypothetical protein RSA47_08800 [Pantoea ananatis]KTR70764.1 hypothetical protein NS296_09450 [Pantoea ananatis]
MRQHHPAGEACRAEAILHDPPIQKSAPTGRVFRFKSTQPNVRDENLQQVRLNRGVIQADAPASPGGRGNPARPTNSEKRAHRVYRQACSAVKRATGANHRPTESSASASHLP